MMRILAEAAGRSPPWILPVPVLSPRLSAYWLRFVTAVPTNIARALIEGLKHDFTAHPQELRRLVPQRLLGFRESVAAAFAAERNAQVLARWTEGAFNMRQGRIHYPSSVRIDVTSPSEILCEDGASWLSRNLARAGGQREGARRATGR